MKKGPGGKWGKKVSPGLKCKDTERPKITEKKFGDRVTPGKLFTGKIWKKNGTDGQTGGKGALLRTGRRTKRILSRNKQLMRR